MFEITEAREFIEQKMKEYQIFDHYRIVDTDTYLIHRWDAGEAVSQAYRCYEIWNHNSSCENCISKRAVEECRQIIKLETLHGKVFLIAALPAPELGPRLAIELIQDVTDSFHINVGNHQENMSMADLIQKMNDMAIRDSYTGLYNKQFLEHELHRQTLRWAASTPLVIVLLDIDQFKYVNDTYGHLTGDEVILTLAKALDNFAKGNNGWASRVGGDEFMLVFLGLDAGDVTHQIQAFRKEFFGIEFGETNRTCHISISVGIAEFRPEVGDWRTLFRLADEAMYRSKQRYAGNCPPTELPCKL